jgi:hypothetical protein
MTDHEASILAARNLRESMRLYSCASASGHVRDYSGLSVVSSGLNLPFFNSAVLTGGVTDRNTLQLRVDLGHIHFGTKGLPWSFWLCPEYLAPGLRKEAGMVFQRVRMRAAEGPVAMVLERDARVPDPVRMLPEVSVERVTDGRMALDFCDVSSEVFGLPIHTAMRVYGHPERLEGNITAYVSYAEGRPAGTAMVVEEQGSVGFYSVATRPYARRLGYAEAMMRVLLNRYRGHVSVLHSTPSGLPLYLRLGYRRVFSFEIYYTE